MGRPAYELRTVIAYHGTNLHAARLRAEKLGMASRYGVLPLAEVAGIVTDGQDHDVVRQLQQRDVPVLPSQ